MDNIERYDATFKEWKNFMKGLPINEMIVSPLVRDSWARSKKNGVNPAMPEAFVLGKEKISGLLERNKALIEITLPIMKNLYSFVEGSGFLVCLFDSDVYLLDLLGDRDVLEYLRDRQFVVGCCWGEKITGTNAGGMAARLRRPVQIFATEHYCRPAHGFSSSAAPIRNSSDKFIGLIVMTGPYKNTNPHTLGMVAAAAYTIENEIKLRDTIKELQIAHSFQKTVMSSMPEIVIAIDNDGNITVVNKSFENIFGSTENMFVGKSLESVFGNQNKSIQNLIKNNSTLTDSYVRISYRSKQSEYTLSCYPISSQEHIAGKVIVLNEIKRAKTLATKMMGANAKFSFDDIVGQNSKFMDTIRQGRIASQSKSNVLLLGESGTGKDILAQAIHNASDRNAGPYVAINCAAIPRELITSDLFGYSEGAFTGSRKGGSQGKFELADGGTIFLDEIGEIPLDLQAALLRVIEDKSIMKVGGTSVKTVDVRILAATNKDLKEEVRKGNFRQDLFYRLNVFTIHIPSLRERVDDIPLLVDVFINHISDGLGKKIERIEHDVLDAFMHYNWPGNVRELQNVLDRMINMSPKNILTFDLLPSEVTDVSRSTLGNTLGRISDIEREMIGNMIKSNIPKRAIAKKLGMARSTLYRKLKVLHWDDLK